MKLIILNEFELASYLPVNPFNSSTFKLGALALQPAAHAWLLKIAFVHDVSSYVSVYVYPLSRLLIISAMMWHNVYICNKTECFSYEDGCAVHGHHTHIEAFKRRAGLGYI